MTEQVVQVSGDPIPLLAGCVLRNLSARRAELRQGIEQIAKPHRAATEKHNHWHYEDRLEHRLANRHPGQKNELEEAQCADQAERDDRAPGRKAEPGDEKRDQEVVEGHLAAHVIEQHRQQRQRPHRGRWNHPAAQFEAGEAVPDVDYAVENRADPENRRVCAMDQAAHVVHDHRPHERQRSQREIPTPSLAPAHQWTRAYSRRHRFPSDPG